MASNNISEIIHSLKTLIENAQWQQALNLLESNQQYIDPALYHYNLGVIHTNLTQKPVAMYHFEQAQLLGFRSNELFSSISALKYELNLDYIEQNLTIPDQLNQFLLEVPVGFYFSITLIILILLFLNLKKIPSLFLKLFILVISIFPIGFNHFYVSSKDIAIAQTSINIYAGPSKIFDQVQDLPQGAKIIIAKHYNGWKQIIYPQRFKGWILSDRYLNLRK